MQSQFEIRTEINNQIIESLKEGRIPWIKPWSGISGGPSIPSNLTNNRPYSGVNILLTWMAEQRQNWPVSYWATFNQFRSLGCHVRKREKATTIVYWQPIKKTVIDKNGDEKEKTIPILKTWKVFNVAQAEGEAVARFHAKPELRNLDDDDVDRTLFDATVAATTAEIEFGHERAAYLRFPDDKIIMPDERRFSSFSEFGSTLFHEIGHWSEFRLNWTGSYALGELRAEIASAYLARAVGIANGDCFKNVKAYCQNWLQELENDPKFIFHAATAASKAADYILSFSQPQEEPSVESNEVAAVA